MKLLDIINSSKVLNELNKYKDFSAVCAFRIAKNIDEVNKELSYYSEQRENLLKKFSDKDSNGDCIVMNKNGIDEYQMSDENKIKYVKELFALHNEEITINIKKITLEQLGDIKLSPADLKSIEFMIDEE